MYLYTCNQENIKWSQIINLLYGIDHTINLLYRIDHTGDTSVTSNVSETVASETATTVTTTTTEESTVTATETTAGGGNYC